MAKKTTYRGIPNTEFIWHGAYSDPEVIYKGVSLNYYDVEDCLWGYYKDVICTENNETPTNEGYENWLKNESVSWLQTELDELISCE